MRKRVALVWAIISGHPHSYADELKFVRENSIEQKEVLAILEPLLPKNWKARWENDAVVIFYSAKAYKNPKNVQADKFSPESNAARAARLKKNGELFKPAIRLVHMPFLKRAQFHLQLLRQKKITDKIAQLKKDLEREQAWRDNLTDYGRIPESVAFKDVSARRQRKLAEISEEIARWQSQMRPVAEICISNSDFRIESRELESQLKNEVYPFELSEDTEQILVTLRKHFDKVMLP